MLFLQSSFFQEKQKYLVKLLSQKAYNVMEMDFVRKVYSPAYRLTRLCRLPVKKLSFADPNNLNKLLFSLIPTKFLSAKENYF